MSRHNKLTPRANAGNEGYHLTFKYLIPCLEALCISVVRVGLCVAMTWEMLHTTLYACIPKTLQIACYHRCRHVWIVREGARTYTDILWIGIHIGHWSEVNIKTIFVQICAYHIATVVCLRGIASISDALHRDKLLHIKLIIVAYTRHSAALFVYTQQRSTVQSAYLRDKA